MLITQNVSGQIEGEGLRKAEGKVRRMVVVEGGQRCSQNTLLSWSRPGGGPGKNLVFKSPFHSVLALRGQDAGSKALVATRVLRKSR